MATSLPLFILLCLSSVAFHRGSAAPPLCPRSDLGFVDSLRPQCPLWIERSLPLEVSGDTVDRELGRVQGSDSYYSVLFYASWCPFSCNIRPTFDALSSMFPQISHLAVEESSATPSVLSRYGVHSFPSILVPNRTTRVPYDGPKDLSSLVRYYKETTGLEPVAYFETDRSNCSGNNIKWDGSIREIAAKEPYLALALLFLSLKAFIHLFPKIASCFKDFWVLYGWHLNLVILAESSHLLGRALHVVDLKKLWRKLRLCNKTRNFQNGAKNARVWASSFASVSLGESSSVRSAHSGS